MEKGARNAFGVLLGILTVLFGPWMFSNFYFKGTTLHDNVWAVVGEDFFGAMWQLFGGGFSVNIFYVFSAKGMEASGGGFFDVITDEVVWPTILTWFSAGLFCALVVRGKKSGVLSAIGTLLLTLMLWLIIGILAGADLGQMFQANLVPTLGMLLFPLPFVIIGGLVGGWAAPDDLI